MITLNDKYVVLSGPNENREFKVVNFKLYSNLKLRTVLICKWLDSKKEFEINDHMFADSIKKKEVGKII